MERAEISNIVEKFNTAQGGLIGILQEIQSAYSYLPAEALVTVAELTNRPLVEIYGVATFYKSFSLKQRGKHLCSVCTGTACHVRGAPAIADEFEKQLNIQAGDTTEDKEFSLETVNCLGACALGPIVVVDGHYYSNVKAPVVKNLIEQKGVDKEKTEIESDKRVFPVSVSCPRCNHNLMDGTHLIERHPSIRVTVSFGRKHGWLRLSSLYGSNTVESEHDIAPEQVADFFCPHCHAELAGSTECGDCSAPAIPMIVQGGGIVQICSRAGCNWHLLDVA